MILNRQSKCRVDLSRTAALTRRLGKILRLDAERFNVCFVDDEQMRSLNGAFRRKSQSTDVLSFPWNGDSFQAAGVERDPGGEFKGFLGDVVISLETARRNAQADGHTTSTEIGWLVLHGLLHLIGMDHETDNGEMTALEHQMRARLGLV